MIADKGAITDNSCIQQFLITIFKNQSKNKPEVIRPKFGIMRKFDEILEKIQKNIENFVKFLVKFEIYHRDSIQPKFGITRKFNEILEKIQKNIENFGKLLVKFEIYHRDSVTSLEIINCTKVCLKLLQLFSHFPDFHIYSNFVSMNIVKISSKFPENSFLIFLKIF